MFFVAAGGGQGVAQAANVLEQRLRTDVAVGHQRLQMLGNFAVFPQPHAFAAVALVLQIGLVCQVELPFVERFEQPFRRFVGQHRQFVFVAQRGDFAALLRQFFRQPHRLQPRMLGGKLVERLFRQVVGFVDAVKTVFRRRQNHAAAHIDVHHQQIVVGHHHIGVFQRVARQVKRTFGTVWAGGFQAAVVVVAHFLPQRIVDFIRPLVAVAVKFAAGKTLGDVVQQRQIFRLRFFVPQHRWCFKAGQALLGVVLRQLVEPVGAEIAAAPLGQCEAQFQPAVGHHKRQIAADQLFLQGDGGAGHHQPLAACLRHNAAGQQISQRLADAGRPLHHHNALALAAGRLAVFRLPLRIFGRQGARKSVGHRRNHLALGGTRAEVGQVVGQGAVVVADGVFFEFGEHGKIFQAACNGGTDIARPAAGRVF